MSIKSRLILFTCAAATGAAVPWLIMLFRLSLRTLAAGLGAAIVLTLLALGARNILDSVRQINSMLSDTAMPDEAPALDQRLRLPAVESSHITARAA